MPDRAVESDEASLGLDLLKGRRDAVARQQTLRATIEWSHDLLTVEEQQLFARLAVFAGGCGLEAAEQVTDADLDVLQSLVEKSLLRHIGDRFSMLETIGEYGAERLDDSGYRARLTRRHAKFYLDLAEREQRGFRTPNERASANRMDAELDNIRKALEWFLGSSQIECGLRLASALGNYWGQFGGASEGRRWLEFGLARSAGVAPPVRAAALVAAGSAAFYEGDYVASDDFFAEALSIYREIGNEQEVARILVQWAINAGGRGDFVRASALGRESLALAREIPDPLTAQHALLVLGEMARREGNGDAARALLIESVSVGRKTGDLSHLAAAIGGLGDVALEKGELGEANRCYREALEVSRGLGIFNLAYVLVGLAATAAQYGDVQRAGRLWGAFERLETEEALRLYSEDRTWYERFILTAEGPAFVTASQTGRHMDVDAAVTFALSSDCDC